MTTTATTTTDNRRDLIGSAMRRVAVVTGRLAAARRLGAREDVIRTLAAEATTERILLAAAKATADSPPLSPDQIGRVVEVLRAAGSA